jgi:hypothetical protein
MSKAKQQTLHQRAMAIYVKLTDSHIAKARRAIRDYNAARKEATFQLKPIFAAMQEKFEEGEKIEACSSMKEYCKVHKHFGCLTYARVRQILTDKSGNEGRVKSSKSLDLKPGTLIGIDPTMFTNDRVGTKIKITAFGKAWRDEKGKWHIEIIGEELNEMPAEIPAMEIYTETCLTCGNQRTDDESDTLVTIPRSGNAFNGARIPCQKCGTKASAYNKKKFASKPVGWQPATKPKPATQTKIFDPQKDLLKRFRAAKKVAKFYVEMMKELTDGVDRKYAELRELYPDGKDLWPWHPPTKEYCLPKSEEEFQAECDKATGDFHALLDEGKAAGVLTEAPRKKKMSEPAKSVAAAVDAAVPSNIAPQIIEAVKRQKARIALGLEPFNSACPEDEHEEEEEL